MPTLTDADMTFIRAKSGDNCSDPVVDDELLQAYFDAASGDRAATIVSVLEDRWAKAKADVGRVTDFGTGVDRANMDHIEDLLNYWRARAGIVDLPPLSVGVMNLGIDADGCEEWAR